MSYHRITPVSAVELSQACVPFFDFCDMAVRHVAVGELIMNIKKLSQEYVRQRALAGASGEHYEFVAALFVRDVGIEEVSEVTREVLLNWRVETLARGVSGSTWNNYLRHMRVLLSFAEGLSLLPLMPRDTADLAVREHVERPKTITIDELRAVMTYVSGQGTGIRPCWYWATVLRTLFYTGMRRRQLTELLWRDVNLDRATIQLRATASKNRRGWVIPIAQHLLPSLEDLYVRTRAVVGDGVDLKARYVFDISLFTRQFRSCQGGQMTTQSISNFFSRVRSATGIDISAHKLRHTMATELAELGLYKELQSLLGHTDVAMTMRYVHPQIEQLRSMTEQLSSIDAL